MWRSSESRPEETSWTRILRVKKLNMWSHRINIHSKKDVDKLICYEIIYGVNLIKEREKYDNLKSFVIKSRLFDCGEGLSVIKA